MKKMKCLWSIVMSGSAVLGGVRAISVVVVTACMAMSPWAAQASYLIPYDNLTVDAVMPTFTAPGTNPHDRLSGYIPFSSTVRRYYVRNGYTDAQSSVTMGGSGDYVGVITLPSDSTFGPYWQYYENTADYVTSGTVHITAEIMVDNNLWTGDGFNLFAYVNGATSGLNYGSLSFMPVSNVSGGNVKITMQGFLLGFMTEGQIHTFDWALDLNTRTETFSLDGTPLGASHALPGTAGNAYVGILTYGGNKNTHEGVYVLDNFSIVIPEPATLGLLALGGLMMVTRRNK